MKKIYLIPETKVITVALSAIMSASNPDVTVDTNDEDAIEAGEVESRRRRNIWDDEEEEMEDF